ncbi:hypothetical protein DL98DRAFT_574241 [Cadophora sp. DSE1049]|nr:hypothetical protein DL98DRAFT_574241 [Cadophora sp. DSE1049]
MEYINGEILNSVASQQIDQIVKILSHFSTIQCQRPGPLQPGVSRCLLWEENGKPTFETIEQVEAWLNLRLPDVGPKLALKEYPLVLCHLDLALRNIVDWASAGFYPRFFEICLLKITASKDNGYGTSLISRLEKLTDDEEAQVSILERSYYNGIRYSFPKCRGASFSGGS